MKRMLACSILVLVMPVITTMLQHGSTNNAPFASTALAGHTLSGTFCQCGCPGCFCDPDENIDMCLPEAAQQISVDASQTQSPGPDVPAAAFFLGTGLLILKRLRG
jgi:hypothetical protein